MASQCEGFDVSGPVGLTHVDWSNPRHRRAVMACLVQAVYTLEDDRLEQREGPQALAPPWSESFHFQLRRMLLDSVDSSIIGAIFEYKPPSSSSGNRSADGPIFKYKPPSSSSGNRSSDGPILKYKPPSSSGNRSSDGPIFKYKPPSSSSGNRSADGPRFVVAFRGTMVKVQSFFQDIEVGLELAQHGRQSNPRFETAIRDLVATAGASRVWLAGHSLGSAIALQAGKNMAKSGSLLESFLFNPPYPSAPIEKIESEQGKKWLRVATSAITAALTLTEMAPREWTESADSFAALSPWVPQLFVNKADHICSEYIGYFEHRNKMEEMGAVAGSIQRIATRHSLGSLARRAMGERAEPSHLIPSANLTINSGPPLNFMEAHGIRQWWQRDLRVLSEVYKY